LDSQDKKITTVIHSINY